MMSQGPCVGDDHKQMLSNRLFESIRNADINDVIICIEQGVDLTLENVFHPEECSPDNHVCPLALACCTRHEKIMVELLKSGANPNQFSGRFHQPVMHIAADEHSITLSIITSLISYGADVNLRGRHGKTILHYLSRGEFNDTDDNLLSAAKFLLNNGASFHAPDETMFTPLYWACRCGNVDLVRLFITEGADVNVVFRRKTLLIAAAESCNADMFDLLLSAGAERNLPPNALIEPCARNDHVLIARILDTCDMNINMTLGKNTDMSILHYACDNRDIKSGTIQLLIDHGADVRAVSGTGDTVLHYAANYGDCSKIYHLLSYNLPINTANNQNQTPLAKYIHSLYYAEWYPTGWFHARYFAYKKLRTAGAMVTADVEHALKQLRIEDPETQISDYEISSTKSLKELCRFLIRERIPLPVDASLCKLPIPKLLREYLNFPEFYPLVEAFLNIHPRDKACIDKC